MTRTAHSDRRLRVEASRSDVNDYREEEDMYIGIGALILIIIIIILLF
jgi:hypothetical protein